VLLSIPLSSQAQDCLTLSEAHQIFQLRDATQSLGASDFCVGAYDLSSLQLNPGRKHLKRFLHSNPPSNAAYRSHELLSYAYLRTGQYKNFLSEIQSLLKLKPDADDAKQGLSLATALAKYPNQHVTHLKPTSIQSKDGAIPILINGKSAAYGLDTGTNLSFMSENEATRFGMKILDVTTPVNDSGGLHVGTRIAVAKDLFIDNIHLENVAFLVFPDSGPPFNTIPEEQRGLLGIPVILAMRSYSYDRSGNYRFDASNSQPTPASNMLFDGANPVIQVISADTPLDFTLDTGAGNTDLYPAFGKALPYLLTQGNKDQQPSIGIGGTVVRDATRLKSVTFKISNKTVTLAPAFILDDTPANAHYWAAGNLGNDLLHQADKITLDFTSMTLTLE
jgi:hypothetical protein